MSLLTNYNKINRSYKRKLVFNFGPHAGFYSEFNNMVYAILYCLKYKYRFILYSFDANFKYNLGWEDYFEPFCDSTKFSFHQRHNPRKLGPIVSRKDPIYEKIYELLNPNTFLTHQLWPKFYNPEFEKEHFDIPKLGIKGNLRESSRKIVEMIYNFNSPTKNIIHSIIEKLNLPPKYASIHIRRGDKATEVELLQNAVYIDRLKQETDLRSIFVSTDDFAVLAELEKNYGEFNFFTLTEKGEKGYVLEDFGKLSEEEKEHKMLILFASMEIICKSDCFVGTYITNLGNFAGMKMPDEKIHSVQKASWYQFEDEDVKDQYYFKERARELSSRS